MKTKFCRKCNSFKLISEFHKNSCRNDGLADWCKECIIEHKKSWYKLNKENILERQEQYTINYRKINKEKVSKWNKKYVNSHRNQINLYNVFIRKNNKNLQILHNLRGRLNLALKNNSKTKRTLSLLDCSIKFLKHHLESQFKPGMTWDNYGKGINGKGMQEWHIDHIIPCARFNLSKPEQQKQCFHYTNLQPLWAIENLKKNKF